MTVKPLGSQMGSPAAAEGGGEVRGGAVKQTILRIFGPEIIDQLKPPEVRFQKTVRSTVFCHFPRNFENVKLVSRRREHFRGFLADLFVAKLPPKGNVLIYKNSLASCQLMSSQHRVTRSDVSFQRK